LYGPPALLAARLREVGNAIALLPGARLDVTEYDGDVDPADVSPAHRTQLGIPSNDAIEMIGWRGGTPAHSDIGVVCAPTAVATTAVRNLVGPIIEDAGFDYAAGFMLFRRHVIALCLVMFDGDNPAQRAGADTAIRRVISEAGAAGYGTYRSHVDHMDEAAALYSFNDHAARRLGQRLKDALDPQGILSPGKQGIWPSTSTKQQRN
jgi:4-cresol dehydrogenase (hydroxylating)